MSGFTLMISGNTLNFWLAKEGVNIKTIGIFALISLPYAVNFLWAPIFDTKKLPLLNKFFGQRISWIILIQASLSINVYLISLVDPSSNLISFALCGLGISFFASAQDAILGAIRTEMVKKNQQGAISGMYVFGYRIGMLISGYVAIYFSEYFEWNLIYTLFSIIIITFPISIICFSNQLSPVSDESKLSEDIMDSLKHSKFKIFYSKIIKPIGSTKYLILVLLFLILYRLSDNFITMMINPFLLHIGYDAFEIANAGKLFGVASAIVGGLIASHIMKKKDLYSCLIIFGVVHALAHMLFIVQELYGKNLYLLFIVTGFESISGGMTMAAYIAFIASLCHGKFRATQHAFLSSMMGFSRSIFPALSGYIVASFGWVVFYLFTTIATLPSIILIYYLKNENKGELRKS
jgi:PAT family beta-lactamase induction signal transducer AmpG